MEGEHGKHSGWLPWIMAGVALLTTWTGMVVSWTTLDQRTINHTTAIGELKYDVRQVKENNDNTRALNELRVQMAHLEEQIIALRAELRK